MTRDRVTALWIVVATTLICLTTAGGGMTTTDAVVAFDVTKNIVEQGSIATSKDLLGNEAYRGRGGRYYSPFGIAQSLWNVPFYLAGKAAAAGRRIGGPDTLPKAAVALGTIPAVAGLAAVCFLLLRELGALPRRSATVAFLLVIATPFWPYSGFGFNQPLTALFLWLAVLAAIIGARRCPKVMVWAGLAAGLSVLTRHEMMLAALIVGGGGARMATAPAAALARYAAGLALPVALWGILNWWRFGNPLESGYLRDSVPGFGSPLLEGAAGLLFSPYASLLIYCPIALLGVAGWRALWKRDAGVATLFIVLLAAYLALYSSLGNWMGGRSYGPRYLVPFIPAFVLPLAFWHPAGLLRVVGVAVIAGSVLVQVPGVLVDYAKVRVVEARAGATVAQDQRWSGMPLMLNARAVLEKGSATAQHLSGAAAPPRISPETGSLYDSLQVGLDLWWLQLFYLGILGALPATALGALLAAAAFGATFGVLRRTAAEAA